MNLREAIGRLTGESLVYGLGQAGGRLVQVALVPVLSALDRTEEAIAAGRRALAIDSNSGAAVSAL